MKTQAKFLIVTLILLLIFSVLTAFFFVRFYANSKDKNLTYNESGKVKYQVCLTNNNYFDQACLDEGQSYVADIIDTIKIDYSYFINSPEKLDSKLTYSVDTQILANKKDDETQIVYNKKENLVPETESKSFINGHLDIDYSKYSDVITNFKKDYVLALDAKLIVRIHINYTGTHADYEKVSRQKELTIEMPLSEQTVNITPSEKTYNKDYALSSNQAKDNIKNIAFGILLLGDFVLLLLIIIDFIRLRPYKKEYDKVLEKILKEYDRAIVNVNSLTDISDKNTIEVSTFDELLDVRENVEKPILFYEEKRYDRSTFIIINEDIAYVYVLHIKQKRKANEKNN